MLFESISGYSTIFLSSVDSTNNYAARPEMQSKIQDKTVIMAANQSKGKGQHRNSWESEVGKNLLISIVIKPKDLPIEKQFFISFSTALALKETVSFFLSKNAKIKWPNDIYINTHKIAGILIENSISSNKISRSIIGIGLNVNQINFSIKNATSLKLIKKEDFVLKSVLEYLLYRFDYHYKNILENGSKIQSLYNSNLMGKGEWISFLTPKHEPFKAKVIGASTQGKLRLELQNGAIQEFAHKEVFFDLGN